MKLYGFALVAERLVRSQSVSQLRAICFLGCELLDIQDFSITGYALNNNIIHGVNPSPRFRIG